MEVDPEDRGAANDGAVTRVERIDPRHRCRADTLGQLVTIARHDKDGRVNCRQRRAVPVWLQPGDAGGEGLEIVGRTRRRKAVEALRDRIVSGLAPQKRLSDRSRILDRPRSPDAARTALCTRLGESITTCSPIRAPIEYPRYPAVGTSRWSSKRVTSRPMMAIA